MIRNWTIKLFDFKATYYGQTDVCKELLMQVPANITSKLIDGNQNLDRVILEVFLFN